ncbi:M20 aminoacylase family protein [Roseovarius nanhaiticus]|uniref:Hippurate hydrolase n=1 Tax=Roseovarius nanhaiticus TaxID=573024 RepID=A0A1N7HE67_9RHOB|nr:M20 aminoacylase family protein [Roseovarius nanhaiticus]SEK99973.1 hippurate hydrolase [Roseovarius nanhaiticus]SIS23155.1 hippurate hydrolase [Roseovarius nanhaiticus]
MPIKNRFAETHADITAWRRDIHANPELMFDTHRTSALVEQKLREFGCDDVVTGLGRTGVVGVIKGRASASGKVVGLRADMDALPIHETTGAAYASAVPGKMHACGHDGHTAMLLGAAQYLAETRNFDGTAVVIFQPAEEGGGGADVMCKDGLMERFGIQEVYGMHNWPGVSAGTFAIRPGGFFASTDEFEITVTGQGGHAAKPHEGVDPIVMSAHLVTMLQTITSRNADPTEQMVVSVTSIESLTKALNVIPGSVHLKGTVRTLNNEMRALAETRIRGICEHLGAAMGGSAELEFRSGYPVMVNHPAQTDFAADVARGIAGDCAEAPLVMGGEDFAYMLEERPGAYILVGNGDTAAVHNSDYDFNDEIIPAGCSWWAEIVERRMPV